MPIDLKMPALSPTMEEGTLAKWLIAEGDRVEPGDLLAEIETDKATLEFEAIDSGIVSRIIVAEGTDSVKVGDVIAVLATADHPAAIDIAHCPMAPAALAELEPRAEPEVMAKRAPTEEVRASPLALRLAAARNVDLADLAGSGAGGRIVMADIGGYHQQPQPSSLAVPSTPAPMAYTTPPEPVADVPHEIVKLSSMRRVIARRLTDSKQQVPHIYLTVDVRLDTLLKLRAELNSELAARNVKLSVNDMMIKALALALIEVPTCNVSFAGDTLIRYQRADIAVAVSIPSGLIKPVVVAADGRSLSSIAEMMKTLALRAREGKLQPHEYQGGTASLSNLGMFGIKQFQAVINLPHAMIMAVGNGEQRAIVTDGACVAGHVMSVTGSFDHRAIDGAEGARLMQHFRELVEQPMKMVA